MFAAVCTGREDPKGAIKIADRQLRRIIVIKYLNVMAGLVPAIHVFFGVTFKKTWMSATSAGMTADLVV